MKRGQAAIETMVILAVSVLILIFLYAASHDKITGASEDVQQIQIKNSLRKVADAVDFVYSQAPGASTEVLVTIPPILEKITVNGHNLEYTVSIGGNLRERLPIITTAIMKGEISKTPGTRYVVIKNEGEYVSISKDE